ncbi:hypothetical protein A7E75_02925 [Syntrophotalea acetylenica]|uniref:Uncharacterized protein n=1 Tax=Syntrophotalea acetylenica TaxID=29542 RepID=A0A1L3GE45_SYNAC|nr:hypothetical protein A7E75_02925 [Syntrophotalea acetylenica]
MQIAVLGLLGLLSIATTIIGFFVARTMAKVDANQTILFERQTALERQFFELLGEHRARHKGER